MNPFPPAKLDDMPVLQYAVLSNDATPTGNTKHLFNGQPVKDITRLAVCDGGGNPKAIYLFSCDDDWNVLTDTCHMSIEEALAQADFEYQHIRSAWKS